MPDGAAFMNEDNGYHFSEKDCGLTLLPNSNGEYESDVAFIKEKVLIIRSLQRTSLVSLRATQLQHGMNLKSLRRS